ncbi:hypothetical protein SYNTR_0973 [Candidatus Syntrophocurvum alkaliphilum]|uniref:ABC1 atypical kinase-like domain-containing protein n=1 Tax=Candidatus Syntrophocurvum alkaliphilum TaxID=2293317 RepID=A0A6I6DEA7_9FIRM|nr:AarF/ABC1/UbiB kinase family protein [Candidatus Syntrophocurvum alkaliphilum]QGT99566.1 hypothetical protein SYNTR_0973 [Candidatus Syntrophocurvum alkaliphilum]
MKKRFSHFNNFPRYKEVVSIFAKHGFGFLFEKYNIRIPFTKKKQELNEYDSTMPKRLRLAIEELGPTFIKLGQLLSVRPDILNQEFIKELENLQNNVPPFSFEKVINTFIHEDINIAECFSYINPEPMAAASIAQVHEAELKDGSKVVIKVQRPDIDKVVETDLTILEHIADLIERRTSWGSIYKISDIIKELSEALRNELDFYKEARNADIFYNNFKNDEDVIIPKVYWEFSGKKILTLEYVEGIKISNFIELKKANYDTNNIVKNLVEALFKQIYEQGFFHADPHPGNMAVANGEKIIFYDFGQVGTIDEVLKEKCMDLVMGMIRYDVNAVVRALLALGISDHYINREELKRDVSRLQQKYYGLPLSEIKIGEALGELIELSVKYKVRVPSELSLMVKMLMTIESIVSQLDPLISMVDIAEPYGRRIIIKRYSPENLKTDIQEILLDYTTMIKVLPRELENILDVISEGELKIKMEHANLQKLTSKLDIMSNRLSLAIIVASIIVGTSLMADQSVTNIFARIPLVEVGFATAMILGLFLAYSILRSGRY